MIPALVHKIFSWNKMFASAVYFINTTIMSNPLGENEYPWWVLLPVVLSLILVTYKVKDLWFGIRTKRTFCQSTGKIHLTVKNPMWLIVWMHLVHILNLTIYLLTNISLWFGTINESSQLAQTAFPIIASLCITTIKGGFYVELFWIRAFPLE